nr:hypothetical protein [uncultured Rhodopila sp.]
MAETDEQRDGPKVIVYLLDDVFDKLDRTEFRYSILVNLARHTTLRLEDGSDTTRREIVAYIENLISAYRGRPKRSLRNLRLQSSRHENRTITGFVRTYNRLAMTRSRTDFEVIYDEFRTRETNKEYYAERVAKIRSRLRQIDIYVAVFGGTTALASWPLWSVKLFGVPVGAIFFGVFVGMAILLAVAKPYLKLEDEIERLAGMQSAYAAIAFRMKEVVDEVRSRHEITDEASGVVRTLRNIRGSVVTREDQPADRALIDKVTDRINERYPVSYFFYPPS